MSLDVYLTSEKAKEESQDKTIPIRREGRTVWITEEEWALLNPGLEPCRFFSNEDDQTVFSANITHNMGRMANAAGIYEVLWRPEQNGFKKAYQLVPVLQKGLNRLKLYPETYKTLNPDNGWGSYEALVDFVTEYLDACRENMNADVSASR